MSQILTPKTSAAIIAYVVDFTEQLDGDAIATLEATVTAGTVVIENKTNTDYKVRLLISGGADGETAEVSLAVTTDGGQSFAWNLTLSIINTAQAFTPTTSTKATVVDMAFENMTLAGYEFDASPEERFSALRRLDAMMAEWAGPGRNLDLGYNAPTVFGASDFNDPVGIPDWTISGVAWSLALVLAPAIGKTLTPEAKGAMAQSMTAINAAFAKRVERTLPRTTPRGAGNKPWSTWYPFQTGDM
jgi:hypothetical protein